LTARTLGFRLSTIAYPVSNLTTPPSAGEPLGFVSVQPRTAVEHIYPQLRRAILHGGLRPGAPLIQEELADSFGVSRMPIRDALRMLCAEGLVEVLPYRGARVTLLTMEELEELYAMRIGLEGLAAHLAAAQMTAPVLEQMTDVLANLEALPRSTNLEAFLTVEAEYHRVCYSAMPRPRLQHQVADLRERAERYLRVVFSRPDRLDHSVEHQRALFDACRRRDGPRAEAALQEALRWTLRHASDHFPAGAGA
jgi:DNA-binding GntR family transcriptional regulator